MVNYLSMQMSMQGIHRGVGTRLGKMSIEQAFQTERRKQSRRTSRRTSGWSGSSGGCRKGLRRGAGQPQLRTPWALGFLDHVSLSAVALFAQNLFGCPPPGNECAGAVVLKFDSCGPPVHLALRVILNTSKKEECRSLFDSGTRII